MRTTSVVDIVGTHSRRRTPITGSPIAHHTARPLPKSPRQNGIFMAIEGIPFSTKSRSGCCEEDSDKGEKKFSSLHLAVNTRAFARPSQARLNTAVQAGWRPSRLQRQQSGARSSAAGPVSALARLPGPPATQQQQQQQQQQQEEEEKEEVEEMEEEKEEKVVRETTKSRCTHGGEHHLTEGPDECRVEPLVVGLPVHTCTHASLFSHLSVCTCVRMPCSFPCRRMGEPVPSDTRVCSRVYKLVWHVFAFYLLVRECMCMCVCVRCGRRSSLPSTCEMYMWGLLACMYTCVHVCVYTCVLYTTGAACSLTYICMRVCVYVYIWHSASSTRVYTWRFSIRNVCVPFLPRFSIVCVYV